MIKVPSLKLPGLDGSHLFGFLATYGLFRLLQGASLRSRDFHPKLSFDQRDFCAVLDGVPSVDFLDKTIRGELKSLQSRLKTTFASINKPADLTREFIEAVAESSDDLNLEELAGMGCVVGDEPHESTLCAANGAGHQNLVLSMRDVLALTEEHPEMLLDAVQRPWRLAFELTPEDRKKLNLGNRKPTLRLDPSDERLYALRLNNPTSNDASYRTELGAQALAAAAFGGLPVIPRQRNSVTVGSERRGIRTFFYWGLWSIPASYSAVRSLLATGMSAAEDARTIGVFAAFRAARITGAKGKLSFAPTEPWW
jgi:hypothetical protein